MTITEFLLARIDEDEAIARKVIDESSDPLDWTSEPDWPPAVGLAGPVDGPSGYESIVIDPARVLAECEAKRRIVEAADNVVEPDSGRRLALEFVVRQLASVYADHPDFNPSWA